MCDKCNAPCSCGATEPLFVRGANGPAEPKQLPKGGWRLFNISDTGPVWILASLTYFHAAIRIKGTSWLINTNYLSAEDCADLEATELQIDYNTFFKGE